MPLIDTIIAVSQQWLEVSKGKAVIKVTEQSAAASKIEAEANTEQSSTSIIGFHISNEEEEEET